MVLVTHQLQYLQEAEQILVMKQGRVEQAGTFQYLIDNGMDFSSFLTKEEEEDDDGKEEQKIDEESTKMKSMIRKRFRTLSSASDTRSVISEISQAAAMKDITTLNDEPADQDSEARKKYQYQISKKNGLGKEKEKVEDPQQEKEMRSSGSVNFKVYSDYFTSSGGWPGVVFLIFLNVLCQALYTSSDVWLTYWTATEEKKLIVEAVGEPVPTLPAPTVLDNNSTAAVQPEGFLSEHYFNLSIYGVLIITLVVISMGRTALFFHLCMKSSVALHDTMFNKIIRAPCRFFDVNPVGRILNRFSKDMGSMDELLPPAFFDVLTIGLTIAGILGVILAVQPWVVIPTAVLGVVFVLLRRFYMASARDIKRLEGTARSPVFSQLSTSLQVR